MNFLVGFGLVIVFTWAIFVWIADFLRSKQKKEVNVDSDDIVESNLFKYRLQYRAGIIYFDEYCLLKKRNEGSKK